MPTGVYQRSPEEIERLTKQLTDWVKEHPSKGKKQSIEHIEKRRIRQLEHWKTHNVPNKGVPQSQETKDKISESCRKAGVGHWNKGRTGRTPWNKGIPRTEEEKARISEAVKRSRARRTQQQDVHGNNQ